jgi:hypothetical protein
MADAAEIKLGKSKEEIAFQLLVAIAYVEKKMINSHGVGTPADREWILSTYAECASVVWSRHYVGK